MKLLIPDSTCLIALGNIGQIDLLRRVAQDLVLPPGVKLEVGDRADGFSIRVPKPALTQKFREGSPQLDRGEAEVLALGSEFPEALLVLDEQKARRVALAGGFQFVGTLGLLALAKKRGMIDEIAPLLLKLRATDFRMSDRVLGGALRLAREA